MKFLATTRVNIIETAVNTTHNIPITLAFRSGRFRYLAANTRPNGAKNRLTARAKAIENKDIFLIAVSLPHLGQKFAPSGRVALQ